MLLPLVKKDFILIKKYLAFLVLFAAIAPVYMSQSLAPGSDHSILFFLVVFVLEYVLFFQIARYEVQYRGSAYLCATPYTRNAYVEAKYLFILLVFIGVTLIQIVTSLFVPSMAEGITLQSLGITLLILSLSFGIIIPALFKFGYDKLKFVLYFMIILTPFLLTPLVRWYQSSGISLSVPLPIPQTIRTFLLYFIALLICFVSMFISIKIYEKKDL
ncbi:ABC-2 transporter permease [Sporolactobacillus pectinivorans]|uniref:ABC-2 transporter permease n=1 Tax=Sporolactobacillus pectinivorans TaxID=1591408 RepID=UPI000C26643C|nr:ABC-2 transporter permease [Sporolactobacillus pectinivorans]